MNLREIALYLKIKGEPDPETEKKIRSIYPVAERTPSTIAEGKFFIRVEEEGVALQGTDVLLRGNLAKRHFDSCDELYVVLVSMGMESERQIKAHYALSPTSGVILDACYSEVIERRLDEFAAQKEALGEKLTSRISCGYGDLPLSAQTPLLKLLAAERIGVYQNDSLMLVPNKSVVALLGVKR